MSPRRLNPSQQNAVHLEGRSLLVTAGAGTGKTTVLVERVLHKVRSGSIQSLDRILVVTFTEKAAREMKDRLYRELVRDPDLRRFLPQVSRAWISTIHGFCARLLRERFLEAQVEPGFRILPEHGRQEALDDALRRVFHSWYLRKGQAEGRLFLSLVEMGGFDEEGEVLRKIVQGLYEYSRVTPDPEGYLDALRNRPPAVSLDDLPWMTALGETLFGGKGLGLWDRALRLYRTAVDLAVEKKPARMQKLLDLLESMSTVELRRPEGQRAFLEALGAQGLLKDPDRLKIDFPRAPGGIKDIPGFKKAHEGAKKLFNSPALSELPWDEKRLLLQDQDQRENLQVLIRIVRQVDELYSAYKSRQGYLDFSDLEIKAARLIRNHGLALGWEERFREVLVDEFQDVNPLQDQILSFFSGASQGFRVGDVKQSIYQFRLADPTIFLKQAWNCRAVRDPAQVPEGNDPLLLFLGENYRSRPEILETANHIFSRLFDPGVIGSEYADQALIPGREMDGGQVPVELHLLDKGERPPEKEAEAEGEQAGADGLELERTDRREALFVARRIRRLIREEHPLIPRPDGTATPAAYSDVAILLRSRGKADLFLEALEDEGVPAFRQEGGSLLDEDGVRDFRALLALVDNPRDDVVLAAVLRSPLVGIEDGDLVRLRLAWPESRSYLDAVAAAAFGLDAESGEENAAVDGLDAESGEESAQASGEPAVARGEDAGADSGIFWPQPPPGWKRPGGTSGHWIRYWTGDPAEVPEDWIPASLRRRLRAFLDRLATWRLVQGRMELGRLLETIRRESGLEAALLGRPDSALQQAAVERFLALARDFEAERGPSLHGFLARVALQELAGTLDGISRGQDGENAVALLTVHKAKGLEFPIVVLPQLQWPFQRDRLGGRICVGESWVGLRELDFETWGRRDTWARRTLEMLHERSQREEEARVLYVALTRARERLILAATPRGFFDPPEDLPPAPARAVLETEERLSARSALQWIQSALPWEDLVPVPLDANAGAGGGEHAPGNPRAYRFVSLPLAVWIHPAVPSTPKAEAREAEAAQRLRWRRELLNAAGTKGASTASAELEQILERVSREAPHPPLAGLDDLKGKYWVTELKGPADAFRRQKVNEEGSGLWVPDAEARPRSDDEIRQKAEAEAAGHRGTIYHAALARLDFSAVSPGELDAQFGRFSTEPWWEGVDRDPRIEAGIARFFAEDPGLRLKHAYQTDPGAVEREVAFSLRWPVRDLARLRPELTEALAGDPRWTRESWGRVLDEAWVLVQGRIDCVFKDGDRWVLVDWKTDRVTGTVLDKRISFYTNQMLIYSRAVKRLWGHLDGSWLAFLAAGRTVPVSLD